VPQLATCVWVGYPSGEIPLQNVEGLPAVFGGSIPAEIWHDFMTSALQGISPSGFVQPTTIPGTSSYPVSYPQTTTTPTSTTSTTTSTTTTHVVAAPPTQTTRSGTR
jgi:penicillin-binding protein 1A